MNAANLVKIFCIFDEFCKIFDLELKKYLFGTPGKKRRCQSKREHG